MNQAHAEILKKIEYNTKTMLDNLIATSTKEKASVFF